MLYASFGRRPAARLRPSSSTSSPSSSIGTATMSVSKLRNAMIAPRYVGASTTTVSPRSRKVLPTSSSASIAPLVISSSSSAGRRSCSVSILEASASSGPARPRVGAYWKAEVSPVAANSVTSACVRSRGTESRSGTARKASTRAMPSPTSARVRSAKSGSHWDVSVVAAMAPTIEATSSRRPPAERRSAERERQERRPDHDAEVDHEPPAEPTTLRHARQRVVRVRQREHVGDHLQPVRHLIPRDEQSAQQDLRKHDRGHELHRLKLGARECAREETERHPANRVADCEREHGEMRPLHMKVEQSEREQGHDGRLDDGECTKGDRVTEEDVELGERKRHQPFERPRHA